MARRVWIDARLAELEMKHLAFAHAAGVSESTVERWIAGEVTPVKGGKFSSAT